MEMNCLRKSLWKQLTEEVYAARIAAGVCVRCGAESPAPNLTRCRPCLDVDGRRLSLLKDENPELKKKWIRDHEQRRRARDPNAGKKEKRRWTSEEDAALSDCSMTFRQIGLLLGRSEKACKERAADINMKRVQTQRDQKPTTPHKLAEDEA